MFIDREHNKTPVAVRGSGMVLERMSLRDSAPSNGAGGGWFAKL